MVDKRDVAAIISLIGRLASELSMIKSFNQVILEQLSKSTGSDIGALYKEVEVRYAKAVLKNSKIYDSLVQRALDPEKSLTIEDLLREYGDNPS